MIESFVRLADEYTALISMYLIAAFFPGTLIAIALAAIGLPPIVAPVIGIVLGMLILYMTGVYRWIAKIDKHIRETLQ